jgi:hypothetical protein
VDIGRAEIEFYAHFPKLMPNPPIVACFSAEYDTNNRHFQLLLEDGGLVVRSGCTYLVARVQ